MITQQRSGRISRSDPEYRRTTRAVFVAGLATFAAMYCTQALLPELSDAFGVSPAASALSVSVATGAIAVAIVPLSVLSERFGRTRLMIAATITFLIIGLLLPLAPTFAWLLVGRAAQGAALAGVPAVAMAYLSEEIDGATLGEAMGRYVAGTTLGGLLGRVVPSLVLEAAGWRWALATISIVSAALGLYFMVRLVSSRNFQPRQVSVTSTVRNLWHTVSDLRLLGLFVAAFVLMGGFVSAYNYVTYRLIDQPFGLSEAVVGLIFVLYLAGTVSSATAGRLADRLGRAPVMAMGVVLAAVGLAITAVDQLAFVIVGLLLFTGGFFAAHSVASGWVGVIATEHRAEASSMYLFAYYLGSSVLGALGGVAYAASGWAGVMMFVGVALAVAAVIVVLLALATRSGRTSSHAATSGTSERP